MKRLFTLLFLAFAAQLVQAQDSTYFFNIHEPSSLNNSYQLGQFSEPSGWGVNYSFNSPVIGEMAYAPDDGNGQHILCDSLTVPDFTDKIVLIDRGSCEFGAKVFNAQNQGAIGVVIRNNNDTSLIAMGAGQFGLLVTIPVIMIPQSLGASFINEMNNGNTVIASFANEPISLARVDGKVTFDENENCTAEPGETLLSGWQIQATNGNNIHYAHTKPDGTYRIYTQLGTSIISVVPPANYWDPCTNDVSVSFSQFDSATVDFDVQASILCAQMTVDIEVPFLRRCFDNYFDIDYCNLGSTVAEDAYITVQFDELLDIVSSPLPYTDLGNNLYQFDLGDVAVGQCGHIDVTAVLSCDAQWEETLCSVAEVFPNDPCVLPASGWSGANVRVGGTCDGSDVVFTLQNTGTGNMSGQANYQVLRDGQLFSSGQFQLDAGASQNFSYAADGATYRFEAEQEATLPFATTPCKTLEGCATNGQFTTGFFNMFPTADYGTSFDEECVEVIGSYDPNDKTGFPLGYGDKHYIERGTDLQYLIRFQNTGTDTAFNIVVRDTITDLLDLSTLRLGMSSHPLELVVKDGNILEFSFDDIMLPDSFVNEAGSHGYLNFTVSQKPNLALGSVIRNKAGIYFDFNEPIITNETFHEIGENFIQSATTQVFKQGLEVKIAPNPMGEQAIFTLENALFKQGQLEIYDAAGKLLKAGAFDTPSFEFRRDGLPTGSFIFKISLDGQAAAAGTIIIKG